MNRSVHHRRAARFQTRTAPSDSKPGIFRRALARTYPAQDELAIFSMGVSVAVLAVVDGELRGLLSDFLTLIFFDGPREAFQTSRWEGVKLVWGAFIVTVISMASLVASFVLPFTRRRFDMLVQFVLVAHMIIITASHFVAAENGTNHLSTLIGLAYFLYLFGYLCCLRYHWLSKLVTYHQRTSREGYIAGVLAVVSILICTLGLNWHWASCYAFAVINAVFATHLIVRMARVNQHDN